MRFIFALLLIALPAFGQSITYPSSSGGSSVTTNVTVQNQHITNSTFATGLYGWTNSPGALDPSVTLSHFSNANVQAMKVLVTSSDETGVQFSRMAPVITASLVAIDFRFWFTNTADMGVRWRVHNLFDGGNALSFQDLSNPGNGSTQSIGVEINMALDKLNRTNVYMDFSSSIGSNSSIFIDDFTIKSGDATTTNITTNVVSGSGNAMLSIQKKGSALGISR